MMYDNRGKNILFSSKNYDAFFIKVEVLFFLKITSKLKE